MRFTGKKFLRDKRGDAMLIFVIFLFSLFGMMLMGYSNILRTSIVRQKLYNAVQDGLTLARSEALKFSDGKVTFDSKTANALIKKCLSNNNIKVQSINTWYNEGRIFASGKTTDGTPFTLSIEISKNFR